MPLHINVVEDVTTYPLAALELTALRAVRDLAQTHLGKMGLTAAIDPGLLITDEMEMEFMALAYSLWNQLDALSVGFGLEVLPLGVYWPMVQSAIHDGRNLYNELLKTLMTKEVAKAPLWGEFMFVPDYVPGTGMKPPAPFLVQFGDVRTVLNALGGSSGGAVPLSTGITGGQVFFDVLQANGVATNQKMWLYGETIRRSFNGHLQIDGLVFTDWNDEALQVSPQDTWLRTSRYRPGDHWGCACVVVPYIPNFDAPFPITVEPEVVASAAVSAPTRFDRVEMDHGGPQNEFEQFVVSTLEEFYAPTQPRDRSGKWTTDGRSGLLSPEQWAEHRAKRMYGNYGEVLDRAFGKGIEGIFGKSGSPTAITPWPSAGRRKDRPLFDREAVAEAIRNPPKLEGVDPRILRSTQSGLVRHHVEYYLSGAWEKTGRTSADQGNAGNAFPVVWVTKEGEHVILSGHHRAAAALAKGEPLPAIVVREQ